MIERIEEFDVDVESHSLLNRDRLHKRNVGVEEDWTAEEDKLAQLARRWALGVAQSNSG